MPHRFRLWMLLAAAFAGALPATRAPAGLAPGGAVDLLLLLAVDVSDSITPEKARLQRAGYVRAIADPAVIAAIGKGRHASIAVSYLEWASADEQYPLIGWTRIADATGARAFADALRRAPYEYGYWTSISAAIDRAASLIEAAPFAAARRVIDLSSDGRNNSGGPVLAARARALARGITINGLVVLAYLRHRRARRVYRNRRRHRRLRPRGTPQADPRNRGTSGRTAPRGGTPRPQSHPLRFAKPGGQ